MMRNHLPGCQSDSSIVNITRTVSRNPCAIIAFVLLVSFGGSLSVTAAPLASQPGTIEITDADAPVITLAVDQRAAVAFASRFQRLGARVDLGRGDGVLNTLPDREIGDVLTIAEDVDTFGDVLTVKLCGERFSPCARRILQANTELDVYLVTGSPQNEFMAKVFTGFVTEAPYDVQAPSATVTALDAAGLYAEKRAKDWSLPPNSGRERLDITIELLGIGGIPIRALDIPAGAVNKPHTLGDRPILDFLRDFLGVLGVEIGFENGGFVARRYDANLPPVLELNPSNLFPQLTIDAPRPLDPNILGVVSTSSTRTELGGYVTEGPLSVVVVGPYAPDTAVQKIDDGVVTETEFSPVEAVQVISESLTTITKFGGVAVRTEKLEYGWLAERAAGSQIVRTPSNEDPPEDYVVEPVPGTVWVFSDGSTRAVSRETYRLINRTVITKDLDEAGRVIYVRQDRYKYRSYEEALFDVDVNAGITKDLPPQNAVPLGDDGHGMQFGKEVFGMSPFLPTLPTEYDETRYTLSEAGEILAEEFTERYHTLPAIRRRAEGAHGYGLDSRTYHTEGTEIAPYGFFAPEQAYRGLRVTTKRYEPIVGDEDSYRITESVRPGNKAPTVTTSDPITGSLPRPEKAEPSTSTQEIRATFEDRDRIALAGAEIESIEHNEFIETQEGAEVYARHRARMASARILNCTMPIESLCHKWRMVRVNIPGASIDGLTFELRKVSRDAASFSQGITAAHYSI